MWYSCASVMCKTETVPPRRGSAPGDITPTPVRRWYHPARITTPVLLFLSFFPSTLGTLPKDGGHNKKAFTSSEKAHTTRGAPAPSRRSRVISPVWQTEVWRQKAFSPIDGVERRNRADAHQPAALGDITAPPGDITPIPQGDITQEHGARREKGSAIRKGEGFFVLSIARDHR